MRDISWHEVKITKPTGVTVYAVEINGTGLSDREIVDNAADLAADCEDDFDLLELDTIEPSELELLIARSDVVIRV